MKIVIAAKTTAVSAAMAQHVASGRAPSATTLQDRVAQTVSFYLRKRSAVQVLVIATSLRHVPETRARAPLIDMYRMEMLAGPSQVSSARAANVPIGTCSVATR